MLISYEIGAIGTLLTAIIILLLGKKLQSNIGVLRKFFIPAPVIGGMILSIAFSVLSSFDIVQLQFDGSLKRVLMVTFFATVGFSASFKFLKKSGKGVVLFLICSSVLVILQNLLGVSLALLLGKSALFGIATSSIPMSGGHGTSAAFGPLLENTYFLADATTITVTAATFGLIFGSLIGGPIGRHIMEKYTLKPNPEELKEAHVAIDLNEEKKLEITERGIFRAVTVISFALGLGEILAYIFSYYSLVVPEYIGAMFAAVFIRTLSDNTGWFEIKDNEVTVIGNISLQIFLAIVLMQINFAALVNLALPMVVILCGQIILMGLYVYFVTFRMMGSNYDAAVIAVGHCGFGLGATPNAIANMEAFTAKNFPSPHAFFILPIVGSLFIDMVNSGVIVVFLNIFGS